MKLATRSLGEASFALLYEYKRVSNAAQVERFVAEFYKLFKYFDGYKAEL